MCNRRGGAEACAPRARAGTSPRLLIVIVHDRGRLSPRLAFRGVRGAVLRPTPGVRRFHSGFDCAHLARIRGARRGRARRRGVRGGRRGVADSQALPSS